MNYSDKEHKFIDKTYHEDKTVVSSYDRRITRRYLLEHKYFTADKWVQESKKQNKFFALDFECGTGDISLRFLSAGIKTISVDASIGMVTELRRKANKNKLDCLCVVADVERLPFKNGVFEIIICAGVLHHIPNIKNGINEQLRILKNKGLIFISEPFLHSPRVSYFYKFCLSVAKFIFKLFKKSRPETLEKPLNNSSLKGIREVLENHVENLKVEYLAYWPIVCGYIPGFMGYALVRFINMLREPGKGDTIIITARKLL
jgi:ubiquinone/menaquinone biosynthesis C-methylase UbiE